MTIQYTPKPVGEHVVSKDKNNPGIKIEKNNKETKDQQIKNVVYPPKLKYL